MEQFKKDYVGENHEAVYERLSGRKITGKTGDKSKEKNVGRFG